MFKSATIKLTLWYVCIVITISMLFSVIIFSIASSEVDSRINNLQHSAKQIYSLDPDRYDTMRMRQVHQAESNLIGSLIITNVCIWFAGGIGSYYLARRTLRPIEQAHDAQSRFTSDASHELRTPLASMKIELEVALRDPNISKKELRETLSSNLEEVNKLTQLSQTLLQLSRMEHDSIERVPVDLNGAIITVLSRFSTHQHRIHYTPDPQPLRVLANQSHVEELVTIFVDNALKYSPADSTVTIMPVRQKQLVGFEITNTGRGIAPDALPKIFDRFYRGDSSRTSDDKKGYGLGLSLAKKLVELHGGELIATSEVDGITSFRCVLPIVS